MARLLVADMKRLAEKGNNLMVNTTQLMQFLERIERLEEEKKALSTDIKETWDEAKGEGFDIKSVRRAYAIRKLDRENRLALSVYIDALSLFEE